MEDENYFKSLFESMPNYKKIVVIIHLIRNDIKSLEECGFMKSDINRLKLEFKKFYQNNLMNTIVIIKTKRNLS